MDRPACAGLWLTPMVHVNGDLTTCCLDEALDNRLGNVRDTPLAELWGGTVVNAWRQAQLRGDFAASGPACVTCNWRSAGAVPAEVVAAWRQRREERSVSQGAEGVSPSATPPPRRALETVE